MSCQVPWKIEYSLNKTLSSSSPDGIVIFLLAPRLSGAYENEKKKKTHRRIFFSSSFRSGWYLFDVRWRDFNELVVTSRTEAIARNVGRRKIEKKGRSIIPESIRLSQGGGMSPPSLCVWNPASYIFTLSPSLTRAVRWTAEGKPKGR